MTYIEEINDSFRNQYDFVNRFIFMTFDFNCSLLCPFQDTFAQTLRSVIIMSIIPKMYNFHYRHSLQNDANNG